MQTEHKGVVASVSAANVRSACVTRSFEEINYYCIIHYDDLLFNEVGYIQLENTELRFLLISLQYFVGLDCSIV